LLQRELRIWYCYKEIKGSCTERDWYSERVDTDTERRRILVLIKESFLNRERKDIDTVRGKMQVHREERYW
jgi:hypothetical protein